MNDEEKRKEELINELVEIRQRMAELNKSAIETIQPDCIEIVKERHRQLWRRLAGSSAPT